MNQAEAGRNGQARPAVVYHPAYLTRYPTVGVECPERVEAVRRALARHYELVESRPAGLADIGRVHTEGLIESVRRDSPELYETALLAAGGALTAARLAVGDRPAFAAIRPPGHHASPDHHWGFCFFNNMAVALAALLDEGLIKGAFVLDFDLHYGDGTVNAFTGDDRVEVFNIEGVSYRDLYLEQVRGALARASGADIIGVSAGFDIGEKDWGGLLTTDDFLEIGRLVGLTAKRICRGRRFGLLEGGYFIPELGKNALAFCRGLFA